MQISGFRTKCGTNMWEQQSFMQWWIIKSIANKEHVMATALCSYRLTLCIHVTMWFLGCCVGLRHFTTFFKKAAAVSLLVEGIFFIPSGDCTLMIYKQTKKLWMIYLRWTHWAHILTLINISILIEYSFLLWKAWQGLYPPFAPPRS